MVEIRDGERMSGAHDLEVTLLADLEHVAVAELRIARPYCGDVPPSHVHHHHAEAVYVAEGEVELRLEDGRHRVGADTWLFVPSDVVHTVVVTGDEGAHTLAFHVPGSGFGDFVRGLHTAKSEEERRAVRATFDHHPAPEYASGDPALVVIARAGGEDGETLGGRTESRRATVLVDADELIVSEFAYGPGERGATRHVHREHADGFLVVEGEFAFHHRDGTLATPAGTLLLFPPNVVHGFDNDSEATARCFNFHMPSSGFGDYLHGRNPGFDQHDPPTDGGVAPSEIVAVRLSGGVSTEPPKNGDAGSAGIGAGPA